MSKMKNKLMSVTNRVVIALTNNKAEGFVDTGIKILVKSTINVE